jgi:hypothetical protein
VRVFPSAALEAAVQEQLEKLRSKADNATGANRAALHTKLQGLEVCNRLCVGLFRVVWLDVLVVVGVGRTC